MFKDAKTPFLYVLFIFLGFFIFTKIFGPLPFSINSITTTKTNLFTVQGTGEATAVPDTAMITLGVDKTAPTVESAQNQVNAVINKITADLKKLGVEDKDVKTTDYSVNPNYDYTFGQQSPKGYSVNASIDVKMKPLEQANQAVDIATKDGANQVGNVQIVLSDDEQKKLEDQARITAVNNAKNKAQSLANAAGIRLGRIVDVQETSGGVPLPMFRANTGLNAGAVQANPPTQLNPGENKVTITVSLSYETY
ncbi:MAG TPA: SIMPL domain-containing protein [Patescibacteria group bacterium]